jgi:C-terminal processing protease CtpA/Prc
MSLRHKVSLLVSLLLMGGIVYAQQATPVPPIAPAPPEFQDEAFGNSFSFFVGGSYIGVHAEDIDKEKASRYGLREARGVGVTSVVAGSPAEKAGLRKDDVILRFDNDTVTSVRKLTRLVSEVAPDQTVRLQISRGGSEQEVAVTVATRNDYRTAVGDLMKTPNAQVWSWDPDNKGQGNNTRIFSFGGGRRIGVSTTELTKQLAEYFGIPEGGVLVTSVSEDSPAAKVGIKAGDVITTIDGTKVESSGDLSRGINKKKEGDVTLTVIRNKSSRTVTVTPREAGSNQIGGPIVVPRIEIPDLQINVPPIAIPEIRVNVPKVKVIRGSSTGPI